MTKQDNIKLRIEPGLAGLTAEQIRAARAEAAKQGIGLHQSIYNLGFAEERVFLAAVAEKTGLEFLDMLNRQIDAQTLQEISANIASHYNIVPVRKNDHTLWLATSDPFCHRIKKEVELVLDNSHKVEFVLAMSEVIKKTVRKAYGIGAATVEQMAIAQNVRDSALEKEDLMDEGKAKTLRL